MEEQELGKFVRWGTPVTLDVQQKVMRWLPEAQQGFLVEIPIEDFPSDEALDLRCMSY